jgi:hypothetical protein
MAPQLETSTKLTNIILNDLNYLAWVRVVKISFKGRDKLRFTTGTTKKPPLSAVPTAEEIKPKKNGRLKIKE